MQTHLLEVKRWVYRTFAVGVDWKTGKYHCRNLAGRKESCGCSECDEREDKGDDGCRGREDKGGGGCREREDERGGGCREREDERGDSCREREDGRGDGCREMEDKGGGGCRQREDKGDDGCRGREDERSDSCKEREEVGCCKSDETESRTEPIGFNNAIGLVGQHGGQHHTLPHHHTHTKGASNTSSNCHPPFTVRQCIWPPPPPPPALQIKIYFLNNKRLGTTQQKLPPLLPTVLNMYPPNWAPISTLPPPLQHNVPALPHQTWHTSQQPVPPPSTRLPVHTTQQPVLLPQTTSTHYTATCTPRPQPDYQYTLHSNLYSSLKQTTSTHYTAKYPPSPPHQVVFCILESPPPPPPPDISPLPTQLSTDKIPQSPMQNGRLLSTQDYCKALLSGS